VAIARHRTLSTRNCERWFGQPMQWLWCLQIARSVGVV
jgi:hypothetical protein